MRLIFLHIPKAGGTTLHAVLENYYSEEEIVSITPTFSIADFEALSPGKKAGINLLKGHFEFGIHRQFQGDNVQYITILRDPVERIISHYHYVLRNTRHYLHAKVTGGRMSLLDYATSDLTTELDNGQLRLLTQSEDPGITCSSELLEQAKENLRDHFLAFGIVEQFDKCLILLKEKLNWQQYPVYRKLNVTKKKPLVIAQEVRDAIAERNRFDVELYQWAKEQFEAQCRQVPDLEHQLAILEHAGYAYGQGYQLGFRQGQKTWVGQSLLSSFKKKLNGALKKTAFI